MAMDKSSASPESPRALPLHSIGAVARRTGLSVHVLRAWERRYGAVTPHRSGGGQRLYTEADIARLRLLDRVTRAGHNIGRVAPLDAEALLALVEPEWPPRPARTPPPRPDTPRPEERFVRPALRAAAALDAAGLQAILLRAVVALRPMEFAQGVVVPLLHGVGDSWEAGTLDPYQEHAVSVAVRRVLQWLLALREAGQEAPVLVAGTLAGEQHEFGALLAASVAAEDGWRVVYLGPSLPADQIAAAARTAGARVVALSVVYAADVDGVRKAIGELAAALPGRTRLIVGGRAAAHAAPAVALAGGVHTAHLEELRERLREEDAGTSRREK